MMIIKQILSSMPFSRTRNAAYALNALTRNNISVKLCGKPLNDAGDIEQLVSDINSRSKYFKLNSSKIHDNLIAVGTETKAKEIGFMGFHTIDISRPWDHLVFISEPLADAFNMILLKKKANALIEHNLIDDFYRWANLASSPEEKGFVIKVLFDVIQRHDKPTALHTLGVTSWASAIARQMGLSALELKNIELAAFLHDLGKIAVPKHILHKTTPLTFDDIEQIHMHVTVGVYLLQKIKWLSNEVIEAVHYHHYYKNYPKDIIPSKAPLSARIIALADAFDVMISGRREYEKKWFPLFAYLELAKPDSAYERLPIFALKGVLMSSVLGLFKTRTEMDLTELFANSPSVLLNRSLRPLSEHRHKLPPSMSLPR